jgi:starch phosphorylase
VPLFYQRDETNLPREWIDRAKTAIRTQAPRFSSQRMVIDYINRLYLPACNGGMAFSQEPVGAKRS